MSNLTHLTPTKRWNRHPPVISVEAWSRNRRLGRWEGERTTPRKDLHPTSTPAPRSTPPSCPLTVLAWGCECPTSLFNWLPHSHAGVKVGPALLYLVAPADQQFCTTTESRVTDTAPPALVAAQPQPSCAFNPIFMGCVIPSRQPEVHWLACYEIATARPLSGDTAVVGIQFQVTLTLTMSDRVVASMMYSILLGLSQRQVMVRSEASSPVMRDVLTHGIGA